VLQLARARYPRSEIFVFARDLDQQQFARSLGASWAGGTEERCPRPLQALIDTTPAWKPVVCGMANLAPGGRLVINAIRKTDDDKSELLRLSYDQHLWMEREIKTVANVTQFDLREFLTVAGEVELRATIQTYPLEQANLALREVAEGVIHGAKVLTVTSPPA
jgi:propanol-preferring alcohol dehydrogenase